MAPLPKYLCWLDFETTSLDPATTTVLECFWELTDWSLNPVASGHGMNRVAETLDMDDYVRGMLQRVTVERVQRPPRVPLEHRQPLAVRLHRPGRQPPPGTIPQVPVDHPPTPSLAVGLADPTARTVTIPSRFRHPL